MMSMSPSATSSVKAALRACHSISSTRSSESAAWKARASGVVDAVHGIPGCGARVRGGRPGQFRQGLRAEGFHERAEVLAEEVIPGVPGVGQAGVVQVMG